MTTPTEDQQNTGNEKLIEKVEETNNNHHEMDEDQGDVEENTNENNGKKSRHRPKKRKLYADICKQMEFYFSDANITKNRMMQEMVMGTEYVDLSVFLDFNRIKMLTTNLQDLEKAITTSKKLELSSDKTGVKRIILFDPKDVKSDADVEECTIYIENVPKHVDHAWLETIFLNFGPLAYISLPKFRCNNQPKGFAFVEFQTAESAKGCLEAYKGEGAILPNDMDPSELMSIQTFKEEQETGKGNKINKHPTDVKSPSDSETNLRKRKIDLSETDVTEKGKKAKLEDDPSSPSEIGSCSNDVLVHETEIITESSNNPAKRKRKKQKTKKTAEEKLEGDAIHLKVMPKKAWRQLRNRYLNLQRQNMSKLKKQLREQNLREQHYQNCMQFNEQPAFEKSNIIEIFLDSPAESAEAFKRQIKVDLAGESEEEAAISGFIKYVDYEDGALQAFVRFNEDEGFISRITAFKGNAEKVFKSVRTLSVQEASEYKTHVQELLRQKRKEQPRKNVRGKDRLLKAATKSCHIRFDEIEEPTNIVENNEVKNQPEINDDVNATISVL